MITPQDAGASPVRDDSALPSQGDGVRSSVDNTGEENTQQAEASAEDVCSDAATQRLDQDQRDTYLSML